MIDHASNAEVTRHIAADGPGRPNESDASAIHASDLALLAALAMRRGATPAAEGRRLERVRSLMAAASDVNRALSRFLKDALVHSQGTPGCSDLAEDTRAVASALESLSACCRHVAAENETRCDVQAVVGGQREGASGRNGATVEVRSF
jgi:hypothetical protein